MVKYFLINWFELSEEVSSKDSRSRRNKKKKKHKMTNVILLSALTLVAMTGITLTTIRYRTEDEALVDDTLGHSHVNPKFGYFNKNSTVDDDNDENKLRIKVLEKRQLTQVTTEHSMTSQSRVGKVTQNNDNYGINYTTLQYSIEDKNASLIDYVKREKVKEVNK